MSYNTLVSAGCSFSNGADTWPQFLAPALKTSHHYNFSRPSGGNGLISRGVISLVDKLLKTHSSEDLLVVIMWSGANRYEVFQSNIVNNDITTINTVNPVNVFDHEQKPWIILNHHWDDSFSKIYYKKFYDEIGSYIQTLEHILRTQWYLEKNNIKYVMTTFAPGVFPPKILKNNINIEYLYNMINHDKFINVDSCMEWCLRASNKNLEMHMLHPNKEQHIKFTEQVMVPFITKLYDGQT